MNSSPWKLLGAALPRLQSLAVTQLCRQVEVSLLSHVNIVNSRVGWSASIVWEMSANVFCISSRRLSSVFVLRQLHHNPSATTPFLPEWAWIMWLWRLDCLQPWTLFESAENIHHMMESPTGHDNFSCKERLPRARGVRKMRGSCEQKERRSLAPSLARSSRCNSFTLHHWKSLCVGPAPPTHKQARGEP